MTIKESIKKYVTLKITSGDYNVYDKVDSENKLATKFGCSRQTARSALSELAQEFILVPKQGVGYIVNSSVNTNILKSFGSTNNVTKTKLIKLETIPEEIEKLLDIKKPYKHRFNMFWKEFYENSELICAQITIINIEKLWKIDERGLEKSVTRELIKSGAPITRSSFRVRFMNLGVFKNYAARLGWTNDPLIIEILSTSNNFWVEKTLRIESKNHIDINFTKNSL